MASARLIGFWKDESKTKVRPIAIGDARRRLLIRAVVTVARGAVADVVDDHQLGLQLGGFEVGCHAMRTWTKICEETGECIFLLDYRNAFNSTDRNLMLKMAGAFAPEVLNLAYFLYSGVPTLMTENGNILRSETGAQQGC